jgi:signal transduction histidine kinase
VLIDDLLTASRLEAGPLEVTSTPIDVTSVARSLASHHGEVGDEIEIRFLAAARSFMCRGDELRVRQILRNLLTNAARYGGPMVEIRIGRDDKNVLLQVVDDGSGIAIEVRERIFEPFVQLETKSRPAESTGLGLYTARRLAG